MTTDPVSSEHPQLHAKNHTLQSRLPLDIAGLRAPTQPSGMLLPQKPAAHASQRILTRVVALEILSTAQNHCLATTCQGESATNAVSLVTDCGLIDTDCVYWEKLSIMEKGQHGDFASGNAIL